MNMATKVALKQLMCGLGGDDYINRVITTYEEVMRVYGPAIHAYRLTMWPKPDPGIAADLAPWDFGGEDIPEVEWWGRKPWEHRSDG